MFLKALSNVFSWGKTAPPQPTEKLAIAAQKKEAASVSTIASSIFDSVANHLSPVINMVKYPFYKGFWKNAEKWAQNLENLPKIGGEHLLLPSQDGAKVSATYISAENFIQKINDAGGRQAHLNFTVPPQTFKGLAFPPGKEEQFLTALSLLTFCEEGRDVWVTLIDGENKYLVSREDANAMKEQGLISLQNKIVKPLAVTISSQELSYSTQATAILCPGIRGRKEGRDNIRDMASYLMLGMNVMMFDYRGTAGSRGFISQKGIRMDLDTITTYLNGKKQIPLQKMLIVGTCFGAGPAAEFAASNKVNLLLNQPFAQAQHFVHDRIDQGREEKLYLPKMVQKAFFNWMGFDYDLPRLLKNAKGHIGLIVNTTDDEVAADQDDLLFAALDGNQGQKIKPIFVAGIEHAAGWNATPVADRKHPRKLKYETPQPVQNLDKELAIELNSKGLSNFGKLQVIQYLQSIGLTKGELLGQIAPFHGAAPAA